MNKTIDLIPLGRLALAFLPVFVVVAVLARWSLGAGTAVYGIARMLIQLLLIGYVLTFIFETEQSMVVVGVLSFMLAVASWIALRPLKEKSRSQYWKALVSIALGGVLTLLLITLGVLDLEPWFNPSKMIPLAGMIFANCMTAISLAAERYDAELLNADYVTARNAALRTALIPITNSLFAVGLVSLPGMMTGQILAGADPLVAARYQIMVMCMLFGSSGISVVCYLTLLKRDLVQDR
jgi:putative ABC transport system permease protein